VCDDVKGSSDGGSIAPYATSSGSLLLARTKM
jgi:hypothetical protein